MLLHFRAALNGIGDTFAYCDLVRAARQAHLPGVTPCNLFVNAAWHHSSLAGDLLREITRRFNQLHAWIDAQWLDDERGGDACEPMGCPCAEPRPAPVDAPCSVPPDSRG